jgi:hypothetical protein
VSSAANDRTENLERDSLDLDEAQDSYRDGSAAQTYADAIRSDLQNAAGPGDARYAYPDAWDALDALVAETERLRSEVEQLRAWKAARIERHPTDTEFYGR